MLTNVVSAIDTTTVTFYCDATTHEVNDVLGYQLPIVPVDNATYVETTYEGADVDVYWGWRIYLVKPSESVELTSGVEGVVLRAAGGNWAGVQQSTIEIPTVRLIVGYDALEFVVYRRYGLLSWEAQAVFITDLLDYPEIRGGNLTISTYTYRLTSGSDTMSRTRWGSATYDTKIEGVTFRDARSTDWQQAYLYGGDLLGFITAPYVVMTGNLVYAMLLFGISMAIYIRYKNLSMILLLVVLLGGIGGTFNFLSGEVYFGLVWVACAFGLGVLYWKVFR